MFDEGSIETDGDVAMEAVREADWKELHRRLRSIAKRRVALEAEEAGYLVEAEESRLYRRRRARNDVRTHVGMQSDHGSSSPLADACSRCAIRCLNSTSVDRLRHDCC